jgi:hypothetical protein
MPPAEQQQVGDRGRSAVGPVANVMRVTPGVRSIAAGEPAVSVPNDQGAAHRRRHDWGAPADVQWFGPPGQHDAHHRGIAGDAAGRLDADRAHVIELAEAWARGMRPARADTDVLCGRDSHIGR